MNSSGADSRVAGTLTDRAIDSPQKTTAFIPIVAWFANHYARPFSEIAVFNELPSGADTDEINTLPRALSAIGFKSDFVLRTLMGIDPIVLPFIAFKSDGHPIVVVDISKDRKHVTVIDFATGEFTQELNLRKLQKSLQPSILLVTLQNDATMSRLSPETISMTPSQGHWLWQPMRENRGAWAQVFIAALGINLFGLALPIFVMNVYDRVIPNLAFVTLWTLAGGVVIALLADLFMKMIRTNILEMTSRRLDLKIASQLFRQAMNIKLLHRPGGAAGIASNIRDFENVRDFLVSGSFVAIIDLFFIGIFVVVLWIIVGPIALVPLLAVPLVVVISLIAQIPIGASVMQAQQMATKRHIVLMESLLGIETIKSLNGEPVMQREWENAVAATARINGKTRFWSNFAIGSTMLIQQGVSVVIIVWGVFLVSEGQISIGGLIAANILAGRILAPLGSISQTLIRGQQALKSISAISSLMNLPVDSDRGIKSDQQVRKGSINLKDVTFKYPDARVPAIEDLDLSLRHGETVALLGRVGSGKTTIGKMMVGLIEPDSGLILVDDIEISQFERSELRDGIGYLPQDPELFTGTIRENLLLGRTTATDEELNRALYYSGMDYFVSENPEGLNQYVGEKGNRLSGGQRQAISIARVLLRQPKMLFLDEPTNAMDNATEAIVTDRLRELSKEGVGMLLSTHRHSLAMIADRLIVIDKGKKVLDGPRDEVFNVLKGNQAAPEKDQN